MASRYQRYLLPGLVFQGMLIGGGYATGRELVEFFLPAGPAGGLLGMAVAALVFGLVMAVSFELCRMTGRYDYRHFLQRLLAGVRYAGYSLAIVPLMLFALTHIRDRRDAVTAGLLAGPIGMLPAVCLFVSLMAVHDEIAVAPIPSAVLLAKLDSGWFEVVFQVALLGTLVQTGLGLLHGVNERIARTLEDRGRRMPPVLHPAVAHVLLLAALLLASAFGLVSLIARGYGLLTFGFIAVFVIPVLTIGLWRVVRGR